MSDNKHAQDFEAKQPPWVDLAKWKQWVETMGFQITEGKNHNRTDGGVHYILQLGEEFYDMQANYWDWRAGWQKVIDWIELNARH